MRTRKGDVDATHVCYVGRMARPGATPSDWKTHPMQRPQRAPVWPRVFSHDEMARVRAGLVPEEMEDKWFVVFADGELRLYRSWTGRHVLTVRFEPAPWGERVAELIAETAPAASNESSADDVPSDESSADDVAPAASTQSSADSDRALEHACERLYWILDVVVLGRPLRDLPPARGRTPELVLERRDITTVADDVIVNAANESLLGGGGVDGAIHRAAGRELLLACKSLPEVRPKVRCPTGEARITPAFGSLRARWVVHAVGPRHRGDGQDARLLASAIRASLGLAEHYGARSVALPAISCGVFAYPLDAAAKVAVGVVHERHWRLDTVRFALFDAATLGAWQRAVAARAPGGAR